MDRALTYSYRLRAMVPMLTDEEYREVIGDPATLYFQVKMFVSRHGWWTEMKHPAADRFRERTGVTLHHTFWLLHVRRSDYGPDCPSCGKPYRTPRARFCAECGNGLPLK